MMTHPFGVAGLALNTLSAIGLLKFTADPDAGAPLSHEQLQSLRITMPLLRRPYRRKLLGYRGSIVALGIGFVLQLIDLLTT